MSGHSKWSTIKHKKGAQDAKRGKIFTKIIKEISVAAKMGGGDPNSNPRLRTALSWAKSENMPNDNISRAIKKATGDDSDVNYEEIVYEGYGPANTAFVIECLTDNRNRTVSSIRTIFNKNGGNLGSSNSVQYMFDRKGRIEVEKQGNDEEEIMEKSIEAGADDIITDDEEIYEIITRPEDLHNVLDTIGGLGVTPSKSEFTLIPQNPLLLETKQEAESAIKFYNALENDDDVQKIYSNFTLSDELTRELMEE